MEILVLVGIAALGVVVIAAVGALALMAAMWNGH
jgi:hypothetical protein